MIPRGLLMIEHRLIEKMLDITDKELDIIRKEQRVNPVFIDTIVDFIRTYADRTHHGKEEDILFKELENKELESGDNKIMLELINEHKTARKVVGELSAANAGYLKGDSESIEIIKEKLTFLINFYPEHITKEDKIFFPAAEKYFTGQELENMLNEFYEFDRKMIHEKYNKLYESLSEKYK